MRERELLGEKLREARSRLGMTQDHIAGFLGVTRAAVSQYENGRRDIGLGSLQKLADLFGYSLKYFLEVDATEESPAMAFRTEGLRDEDLETVAWAKRFVLNIADLGRLLNEGRRT